MSEQKTLIMDNFKGLIDVLKHLVRISAIQEFTICAPSAESPDGHYLIFVTEDEIITCFSDAELRTWLDAYLLGYTMAMMKWKPAMNGVDVAAGTDRSVGITVENPNAADEDDTIGGTPVNANDFVHFWQQQGHAEIRLIRAIVQELVFHPGYTVEGFVVGSTPEINVAEADGEGEWRLTWDLVKSTYGFYKADSDEGITTTPMWDLMVFGTLFQRRRPYPESVEHVDHETLKRLLAALEEGGVHVKVTMDGKKLKALELYYRNEKQWLDAQIVAIDDGVRVTCADWGTKGHFWQVTHDLKTHGVFEMGHGNAPVEIETD
jgi:hypothetical protein